MFPGIGGSFLKQGVYGALSTYGTINLTQSSPPQSWTEPLSLQQVKTALALPERSPTDPNEDAELMMYIQAARACGEHFQGRDLVVKQWDLNLDYWVDYFIQIRPPLISVDLFTYKDNQGNVTQLNENVDFIKDTAKQPAILCPPFNQMWPNFTPWPTSAILIRHTAGMQPTNPWWIGDGQVVLKAMLQLVIDWKTHKLPFSMQLDPEKEIPYSISFGLRQGGLRNIV